MAVRVDSVCYVAGFRIFTIASKRAHDHLPGRGLQTCLSPGAVNHPARRCRAFADGTQTEALWAPAQFKSTISLWQTRNLLEDGSLNTMADATKASPKLSLQSCEGFGERHDQILEHLDMMDGAGLAQERLRRNDLLATELCGS